MSGLFNVSLNWFNFVPCLKETFYLWSAIRKYFEDHKLISFCLILNEMFWTKLTGVIIAEDLSSRNYPHKTMFRRNAKNPTLFRITSKEALTGVIRSFESRRNMDHLKEMSWLVILVPRREKGKKTYSTDSHKSQYHSRAFLPLWNS